MQQKMHRNLETKLALVYMRRGVFTSVFVHLTLCTDIINVKNRLSLYHSISLRRYIVCFRKVGSTMVTCSDVHHLFMQCSRMIIAHSVNSFISSDAVCLHSVCADMPPVPSIGRGIHKYYVNNSVHVHCVEVRHGFVQIKLVPKTSF